MVLAQNRLKAQWNRIESPEINPHIYSQSIFNKGGKNIQQRKDSLFSPITLLEEKRGKTFSDINQSNVFLGQSPKAIEIKTEINKWDLIKFIRFCTTKETINKMKTFLLEENICK